MSNPIVLSGMRPTGSLHLGHHYGVLKNWIELQSNYECFFFVADWHALTTDYEKSKDVSNHTLDIVATWLSVGLDPSQSTIFVQSSVKQHSELFLLLSMCTPLSWLERVPTYKETLSTFKDREINTLGFLSYPLLQAADILIYGADYVPVGEDQIAHIELAREIARRFNNLYGKDDDFRLKALNALEKIGSKNSKLYLSWTKKYQETGDKDSLDSARSLVENLTNISSKDKSRLEGYIEGTGIMLLNEPQPLMTIVPKLNGLDGRKMSKSYKNTISLVEEEKVLEKKILSMQTDPSRVKKTDAGDPEKCFVWNLHKIFTENDIKSNINNDCKSARIGCVDCKKILKKNISHEISPIRERYYNFKADQDNLQQILNTGCKKASEKAEKQVEIVRKAIGL